MHMLALGLPTVEISPTRKHDGGMRSGSVLHSKSLAASLKLYAKASLKAWSQLAPFLISFEIQPVLLMPEGLYA